MLIEPGGATPKAYAPLNEQSLVGVVAYGAGGAEPVRKARREDAYRQMYERCRGQYIVLSESAESNGGSSIYWGYGISTWQENQRVSIRFRCVDEIEAAALKAKKATPGELLSPPPPETTPRPIILLHTDAFLYATPEESPQHLGRISVNAPLAVLETREHWYYVAVPDGRRGWVAKKWVAQ